MNEPFTVGGDCEHGKRPFLCEKCRPPEPPLPDFHDDTQAVTQPEPVNPYRCWCEFERSIKQVDLFLSAEHKLEDAKHHAYAEGRKLPTELELYQALLQAGRNYSGGKGQRLSRVEYEAEYLLAYLREYQEGK